MLDLARDLLLESPIPSPVWMPTRSQRLADAALTLRRNFGQARASRASHRLRDIAPSHMPLGGARYVSGDTIEAEVEADITAVNPAVVQGWAWLLLVPTFWGMVVGIAALGPTLAPPGFLLLCVCPLAWALALAAWGLTQHEVALTDRGVTVRRWTDQWLGRNGTFLGPAEDVRATVVGSRLVLESPRGSERVHFWFWPPSAIADLHDKLPLWGVACDQFDHQHRHHRHAERHHRVRRG